LAGVLLAVRAKALPRGQASMTGIVRGMWAQNAQLSLIAFLRLTFEPVTKLLISATAGLAIVAAFDLALRISTQLRIFMQALVQPLLLLGARSKEPLDVEAMAQFERMDGLLDKIGRSMVKIQVAAGPVLSLVGFGVINRNFLIFSAILAIANQLNTVGLVGYYYQLSSGSMAPLVRIQAAMALLNVSLASMAAWMSSAAGVVISYAAAIAYGGLASASLIPRRDPQSHRPSYLVRRIASVLLKKIPSTWVAFALVSPIILMAWSSEWTTIVVCGLSAALSLAFVIGLGRNLQAKSQISQENQTKGKIYAQ
jgi:hypothetical protein